MRNRVLLLFSLMVLCLAVSCAETPTGIGVILDASAQAETTQAALQQGERAHLAFWPDYYMDQQEQVCQTVKELAVHPALGALILPTAIPGSADALSSADTNGLFIAACHDLYAYGDSAEEIAAQADLVLAADTENMGRVLAEQALEMGAETLVYYAPARNAYEKDWQLHLAAVESTARASDLTFVFIEVPDDQHDSATPGLSAFFAEDVPERVLEYGRDTAFFAANCSMQTYLLPPVMEQIAIYPQPCCPSLDHGLVEILGIKGESSADSYEQMTKALGALGLSGRMGSFCLNEEELKLRAVYTYAERWLDGSINRKTPDLSALQQILEELAGTSCELRCYEDLDNYILYTLQPQILG